MKISCADFTFPKLAHHQSFHLIQTLGIEAVDLGVFQDRSHLFPSTVSQNPRAVAKDIRNKLDKNQLIPSDVFLQTGAEPAICSANDPSATIRRANRDTFENMVEFTLLIGCSHITGLPGVCHGDKSKDWALALEETKWRMEVAKQAGVVYSIEPHVGSLLSTPEAVLSFIQDVPKLTLTLDYGHFVYQGIEAQRVDPLLSHASHFHARGGAPRKLQTTHQENDIPFDGIIKQMKTISYGGYICMEYVWVDWEGCNKTDNLSETILLKEQIESFIF